MNSKIFFISDSHLGFIDSQGEQKKYEALRGFFHHVADEGGSLYIIGDFFDFYFEYQTVIPKQCVPGLHLLIGLVESGVTVHFLAGNHDCWTRDFFEKHLNMTVHTDSIHLALEGKKILLMHGDGISQLDKRYRFVRKILRLPLNRWLFRWLHPDWGVALANRMSHASKQQDSYYEKYVGDRSFYPQLEKYFQSGVDIILMGHHHIPTRENFGEKVYINLGDWVQRFTYAEWGEEKIELKQWTPS